MDVSGKLVLVLLLLVVALFVSVYVIDRPVARENGIMLTESEGEEFEVEVINEELAHPWGIDFVDEETALVTERPGDLNILEINTGETFVVDGVPEVADFGQGGLLDVEEVGGTVYLTYSDSMEQGYSTFLGKGELDLEEREINDFEVLDEAEPAVDSGQHFGSRVLHDEGYVYYTVGDRGDKDFGPDHVSQQTENTLGTTVRLTEDGEIPEENPFVEEDDYDDRIYTYGHRNVQGMTMHPETGEIWQSEHGEKDGDEINVLEEGGNYGWPVTHYGCRYGTEVPIGDQPHEREDIVNPVYYWECTSGGFPPAGMTFYRDDSIKEIDGQLLVGNLAGRYLGRFDVDGEVEELDPLLDEMNWRIRDVEQTPDGRLIVLTDDNPAPILIIDSGS